ncbi:hypothetical protein BLNAU_20237 [Blattamonas nauphoetae]|uniref:Uncharacterized protein n=1 Tax=Blattamonas nauphoetae TaxID=2049346 RepID=A0ABQ9WZA8_9EUKA|nr:hypothetical protein BLNAU_20237 [Blattamonas nauphoetae]
MVHSMDLPEIVNRPLPSVKTNPTYSAPPRQWPITSRAESPHSRHILFSPPKLNAPPVGSMIPQLHPNLVPNSSLSAKYPEQFNPFLSDTLRDSRKPSNDSVVRRQSRIVRDRNAISTTLSLDCTPKKSSQLSLSYSSSPTLRSTSRASPVLKQRSPQHTPVLSKSAHVIPSSYKTPGPVINQTTIDPATRYIKDHSRDAHRTGSFTPTPASTRPSSSSVNSLDVLNKPGTPPLHFSGPLVLSKSNSMAKSVFHSSAMVSRDEITATFFKDDGHLTPRTVLRTSSTFSYKGPSKQLDATSTPTSSTLSRLRLSEGGHRGRASPFEFKNGKLKFKSSNQHEPLIPVLSLSPLNSERPSEKGEDENDREDEDSRLEEGRRDQQIRQSLELSAKSSESHSVRNSQNSPQGSPK